MNQEDNIETVRKDTKREERKAAYAAKNAARKQAKVRNREAQSARKLRSITGGAFGKEEGFAFNRLAVGTTASTKPDDNKSLHHPRPKKSQATTTPPDAA